MIRIRARLLPYQTWRGAIEFRARSLASGFRTACRKLRVSTTHRMRHECIGPSLYRIRGNDLTVELTVEKTS